jgi:hypothetical protein
MGAEEERVTMGKTKLGAILLGIFGTLAAINTDALPQSLGSVSGIIKGATAGLGTLLTIWGARDALAKNGKGL